MMEQIWKALWRYSERQIQHIPDETGTRPGGSSLCDTRTVLNRIPFNDIMERDAHKSPLTKVKQDVARQLGIIC